MSLRVVPVTLAQANEYVTKYHRHNGALPAAKFAVAALDGDGAVVGVAIAGQPKARMLADGGTLEISRVCSDGSRNVCSLLYAACLRAAKALGYWRAVTYTLESEAGASLRASGWRETATSGGGTWNRPALGRVNSSDAHDLGVKRRWEVSWSSPVVPSWPVADDESQPTLFGESA